MSEQASTDRDRRLAWLWSELAAALSDVARNAGARTTERDVVRTFLEVREVWAAGVPFHPEDTIVTEMAFRHGRADLVIFHVDGTATVVEAKDGTKGYSHVVAGIGQASLYAAQLAMTRSLRGVRRCLLWSSTGDLKLDALLSIAAESAGCAYVLLPSATMMAGLEVVLSTPFDSLISEGGNQK